MEMSIHTQEPIGNFTGEFKFENGIAYITVKCDDAIPEAGAKLYAHPVPAQQDYKAMCEDLVILLKEIRVDISRVQIGRYCDLEVSLLKISKAIAKAEKI